MTAPRLLGGVTLRRKLSEIWTVSARVQAQQSRITQERVTRDYTLLQLPLTVKYDSTGNEGLLDPTHGIKASATVTPTASLGAGADFADPAGDRLDLFRPRRAGPQRAGAARHAGDGAGREHFQLPPDQRLYAGGSATVRGYKYQSIGPKFPDGKPTGGTSLAACTVEFRQRFFESFGAAVFVDAGQVGTQQQPVQRHSSGPAPGWARATTRRSGRSGWTSPCR